MHSARHAALDRNGREWLRALADPEGLVALPHIPLPRDMDGLIAAALHHSVFPIVARRLKSDPRLSSPAKLPGSVSETLAGLAARSLMLSHHGDRSIAALAAAGIPATLIKGPLFARRLYPDPVLRSFSDIDILLSPEQRAASRPVMESLGFVRHEEEKRLGSDYHEDQWILPDRPNILVEIQDNLVHAPSLTGMSLTLKDLTEIGNGDATSASGLLMVAAVHGAIGHQFEYLRFVVDVCQAGRGAGGPIDAHRLVDVAERNGTRLVLVMALDLAARFFRDETCRDLADRLGTVPGRRLCGLLLSPGTVLRAQGTTRRRDSWRRKLLREAFKRNVRRSARPTH